MDLTLTLEMKGRGTYLVCAPLPPPVRATCLRRHSPDFTVQRSRRLTAPGRWGRARGAREHGSVHGRLDGGALALWRARVPASKPRQRRPAHSAQPPWPVAVTAASRGERRGREKEPLGFRERPSPTVLIPRGSRSAVGSDPTAERAPRRPGPNEAQVGERDGPAWWPARWLSGRRPGAARRVPYSALGHLNSKTFNPFCFFRSIFNSKF